MLCVSDVKQQTGGKKGKKERRKKKGDDDDEELDTMLAELALEIDGKKPPPSAVAATDTVPVAVDSVSNDDSKSLLVEQTEQLNRKNKKKNKQLATTTNAVSNQNKQALAGKKPSQSVNNEKSVEQQTPSDANVDDGDDVAGDEDDSSNKNKKDKRKKDKKDKKDSTTAAKAKGPGKKQLALMQELLRQKKEEEERLVREEEERIRKEEEAENARLEKLRLEQEKKERKKQKEKERKERLKKEGKLLTAKQKADLQRAKISLQIAQQSGQIVVGKAKTEKTKKPIKKLSSRQESEEPKSEEVDLSVKDETDEATEPLAQDSEEEVVDDWEMIVDESKSKKSTTPITTASVSAKPQTPTAVPAQISFTSNNSASRPPENFRSPIICVLGHVDTGKTKLLDYIRKTHVQDNEAGGITQQIGATFVPPTAIAEQSKNVKTKCELKMPGLLIIDTPGHESFTNLRSRGSSLCDLAILVIDIMHGLEKQTLESLELLKKRKTPFVVALNKIDRLYEWRSNIRKDVEDLINTLPPNTKVEFNKRKQEIVVQLAEQSINAALFYENPDSRQYVSLIPTSAHTGDGMGNLINMVVKLTQTMLAKRIQYIPDQLDATVLEVKAIPGLGTTIDVILINGKLKEGDKIVLAGHDGPIVTHIRSLLVPQPLKELRVKSPYEELKVVYGSMGVKIAAHDLEKAVAGLELYVAQNDAEIERYKNLCWTQFGSAMRAIKCSDKGVYVQASTLGSLEALLEFLKESKIPYCGVRIGPVVKKDVIKASVMLEHSPDHAVILAFDVKVERDAQEMADSMGVKIFSAEIIYHLFDRFTEYKEDLRRQRKEQNRHHMVFPCKLRILPNCIFNKRDPIILGVTIEDGVLKPGTPIAVPTQSLDLIGRVATIEHDHKQLETAVKGQEVCVKIEHTASEAPKMYGRHFDYNDLLYSKISRESIDVAKEFFRDELEKPHWQLIIELKKLFQII